MQTSQKFLSKYLKNLPVKLIVLLVLFASVLYLFVMIAHEVLLEKEEEVDNFIFSFISSNVTSPRITPFMEGVTYLASARFMQIAYAILVVRYLATKNFKRALEIAVIGVGGFIINYVMKISFRRVRPPHPLIDPLHNFSFPSGHATSAFIFYGLLVYLIWKTKVPIAYKYASGIILVLLSMLIGFSRVYLRVHYPTDVLAGFCIGLAWLVLSIGLMERVKKKSNKELDSNNDVTSD